MSDQSESSVVSLNSSGILGVVSGAPKVEGPVPPRTGFCEELLENAALIQTYAAVLGQSPVKQDLVEAVDAADPMANAEGRDVTPNAIAAGLGVSGLDVNILSNVKLRPSQWPAISYMNNNQFVLVYRQNDDGIVVHDDTQTDNELLVPIEEFTPYFTGTVIKAAATVDQLRDTHIAKAKTGHWFWSEFFKFKSMLGDIVLGSFVANILAVAVALFSLQVYDRVIPHESTATLWVLAIGAFVAIGLEALLKLSRARLMDGGGRAIELGVQDILMGRLLGMKSDKRPMGSSGTFAAMREFGSVREFFTASTIGSVADIPFIFVFLLLVYSIGGPIVWVLIGGGILMVLPGYFLQRKMLELTRQAQGASAKASRVLQEVIFEQETVKAQRGEARFKRLWSELNGLASLTSSEQRKIASAITFWSQGVQQATYVGAVIMGAFLVFAGELTVGSIIAIGILTSRTLSPLTQMAGTMARWSNVKTALDGLSMIEEAPQDVDSARTYLRRENLSGDFELREVTYRYEEDGAPVLDINGVKIPAGEKAAVLGTNGSGKSTLLKLMAGLYGPTQGRVLLDGVDLGQLEPRDLRRQVGFLSQDVRLFSGTLRDNLNLNSQERDDERLLAALDFAGLGQFVRTHHKGLDMQIHDAGEGLSVGQRQSLGWARLWLQDPKVVLLDEPTAALDQTLENALISRLGDWLEGRTALIATHRVPILALTSRTFILQNGRLAVDGPRDAVIAHLTKKKEA